MSLDRKTVLIAVAALIVGYWFAGGASPQPAPDRPVVRWVVRTAKQLLWLAAFAAPPPVTSEPEQRLVQAPAIGEDGYPVIDHGRGM